MASMGALLDITTRQIQSNLMVDIGSNLEFPFNGGENRIAA